MKRDIHTSGASGKSGYRAIMSRFASKYFFVGTSGMSDVQIGALWGWAIQDRG